MKVGNKHNPSIFLGYLIELLIKKMAIWKNHSKICGIWVIFFHENPLNMFKS